MSEEFDNYSATPPAKKLKFKPKVVARKPVKISVSKKQQEEKLDEVVNKELLQKLRMGSALAQQATHSRKEARPAEVTFGTINSSTLMSFPVPRRSSAVPSGSGDYPVGSTSGSKEESVESSVSATSSKSSKTSKKFLEPWDYENSNYPVTLPLRRPHSGDPGMLNAAEFGQSSALAAIDVLTPAEELGLVNDVAQPQLYFFKLPSPLPLPRQLDTATAGRHKTMQGREFTELPRGFMGKILVYQSGKVKMKLGDALLDVSPGVNGILAQDVAVINAKEKHCSVLGPLSKTAVVTPDVDHLLGSI